MNGGYAQSSDPFVTMIDMLLAPDDMVVPPRWFCGIRMSPQVSRRFFISKVE
jgi:hypothetical protein